jgi:hypothetical protein
LCRVADDGLYAWIDPTRPQEFQYVISHCLESGELSLQFAVFPQAELPYIEGEEILRRLLSVRGHPCASVIPLSAAMHSLSVGESLTGALWRLKNGVQLVERTMKNSYRFRRVTMLTMGPNTKYCWLCGKDIALEHRTTDEHGLSVHQSCLEKELLLRKASRETELWKQAQVRRNAA